MTSGRLSGREDCCVCTLTIHNTVVIAIWSTVTSSVCHCVREEQEEDMMNLCLLIFLRKLYILPTVGFVFVWTNSNQRRETQQGGRQRVGGREWEWVEAAPCMMPFVRWKKREEKRLQWRDNSKLIEGHGGVGACDWLMLILWCHRDHGSFFYPASAQSPGLQKKK